MADLDDFFAKKDKKKSKGKKFTTADDIDKNLIDNGKRTDKFKKGKLQFSAGYDGMDLSFGNRKDNEWKTVVEEDRKDNTGLKIQNLSLIESDCGEDEDGEWWRRSYNSGEDGRDSEMEGSDTGDFVQKKKFHKGPWKVVAQQPPENLSEEKPIERKPEDDAKSNNLRGSYVPPHVRNLVQKQSHFAGGSRSLKTKAAPDVKNEEMFPTLSAAKSTEPGNVSWCKKSKDDGMGFSKARNSKSHSSQMSVIGNKTAPEKLTLVNKYSALSHLTQNRN